MISKLILMFTIFVVLLPLGACSSAANGPVPAQVFVDDSYEGREVELANGGTLAITLECNPKIGLKWELKKISARTVLELINQKYIPPEDGDDTGTEGKETWSFTALDTGESTIYMEYRQPWQQQFPPEKTFTLNIMVR